jgi:hypothetical protein
MVRECGHEGRWVVVLSNRMPSRRRRSLKPLGWALALIAASVAASAFVGTARADDSTPASSGATTNPPATSPGPTPSTDPPPAPRSRPSWRHPIGSTTDARRFGSHAPLRQILRRPLRQIRRPSQPLRRPLRQIRRRLQTPGRRFGRHLAAPAGQQQRAPPPPEPRRHRPTACFDPQRDVLGGLTRSPARTSDDRAVPHDRGEDAAVSGRSGSTIVGSALSAARPSGEVAFESAQALFNSWPFATRRRRSGHEVGRGQQPDGRRADLKGADPTARAESSARRTNCSRCVLRVQQLRGLPQRRPPGSHGRPARLHVPSEHAASHAS